MVMVTWQHLLMGHRLPGLRFYNFLSLKKKILTYFPAPLNNEESND